MKEFEELLSVVKNALQFITPHQYTQVVAVCSDNGYICYVVIDNALSKEKTTEEQLINQLIANDATLVKKLVCIWAKDEVNVNMLDCLDMPSYDFRKMLCDCNSDNVNAEMLLRGKDGFITKTIGQTMHKTGDGSVS